MENEIGTPNKDGIKPNWRQKKLKIVVGINSLTFAQQPAYSNHIQFFYRLGRSYPNIDFCLVNPPRMSIDRMRNMSAEVTLKGEFDYLLFIDDDVLVPFEGLAKLLDMDCDIAAGNVMIRGYPFLHMLFEDDGKKGLQAIAELPEPLGVIDVKAVGFSFCLIKRDILLDVPKPFFITGANNTEDIYFCMKAFQARPDVIIKADTSIVCGHILWPEIINEDNRENYKAYYDKQFPGEIEALIFDRGNEYYNLVTK